MHVVTHLGHIFKLMLRAGKAGTAAFDQASTTNSTSRHGLYTATDVKLQEGICNWAIKYVSQKPIAPNNSPGIDPRSMCSVPLAGHGVEAGMHA